MLVRIRDFIPNIHPRYMIDEDGNLYTDYGKCKMSDRSKQNGYIVNTVCGDNGFKDQYKRHRLVAMVFLEKKSKDQTQVNHKNGIRTDNRVCNLEWCTPKENIRHAWDTHLATPKTGSKSNFAKLNEEQVLEIAKLLEQGNIQQKDIAKLYNVHKATISSIKKRKNWKRLTQEFDF